jgi:calcineurin-like phosphoesterase
VRLGVVNLSGNVFLQAGRPAFTEIEAVLGRLEGKVDHVLVDMHAEATSEKVAMGWHLDGRVSVVVGHPHPRADRGRPRSCRAGRRTSPTSG